MAIEHTGGDPNWYGYCLDDPVNGCDPEGLKARKGALGRIAGSTAIGAGIGAWRGSAAGWPGAIVGGVAGGTSGLIRGTAKEYPPVRDFLDESNKKIIHELTDGKAERMMETRWSNFDPTYYKQTK